jgi:hypothetical protein
MTGRFMKQCSRLSGSIDAMTDRASEGYGVYNSKTIAALCKLPAVREFLGND